MRALIVDRRKDAFAVNLSVRVIFIKKGGGAFDIALFISGKDLDIDAFDSHMHNAFGGLRILCRRIFHCLLQRRILDSGLAILVCNIAGVFRDPLRLAICHSGSLS